MTIRAAQRLALEVGPFVNNKNMIVSVSSSSVG